MPKSEASEWWCRHHGDDCSEELHFPANSAAARIAELEAALEKIADNALNCDPVWYARYVLKQWHWADDGENYNAPPWFRMQAALATGPAPEQPVVD